MLKLSTDTHGVAGAGGVKIPVPFYGISSALVSTSSVELRTVRSSLTSKRDSSWIKVIGNIILSIIVVVIFCVVESCGRID